MAARAEPVGARAEAAWRPPAWIAPLFAMAALVLAAWIALLVQILPSAHRADHWDLAWGGFDTGLAAVLLAVALAARRGSPWLEGAATAAATLLAVDAWFDIVTASSRTELLAAIAAAVLVEFPLAVVCLLIARSAERGIVARLRTGRRRPEGGGVGPERRRRAGEPHPRPAPRPDEA